MRKFIRTIICTCLFLYPLSGAAQELADSAKVKADTLGRL
jgi:hypothetical protein